MFWIYLNTRRKSYLLPIYPAYQIDFKAHYAEKYGIITLGLFGSAARGEHDETSDIDICIKLQEPNYFTIQDIKEDLEKIFRTKVDIISLGAIMRNFFKKSLEEDAIYI